MSGSHLKWDEEKRDYVETHCVCPPCRAHYEVLYTRILELEARLNGVMVDGPDTVEAPASP